MCKKKYLIFISFFLFCFSVWAINDGDIKLNVKAQKNEKLTIKVIIVGTYSKTLKKIVPVIIDNLLFSGQFAVKTGICKCVSGKKDINTFFAPDCRLGIFLTEEKNNTINCRIYDLEYAAMIKEVEYTIQGRDPRGWAHNICDLVWPILTNEPGFFSTKLVYCKECKRSGKKAYRHIYVSDYNGKNEKMLIDTPTVNVAPRWNNNPAAPMVLYSEHTNKNIRLMAANMEGKRKIVSNFEGLNILSAFSPDGKKFAYCASRGDGHCQIYYYEKGDLRRLTHEGNNICPTFADKGTSLYFCSDARYGKPQLYKYDLQQNFQERISRGGFEIATTFSEKKDLLAYCKMVGGLMQLFLYDPKTHIHKQLTYNAGNKSECAWSPCGNYLVFSISSGKKSRLATINILTGEQRIITPRMGNYYYPHWSPIYNQYPEIT